MGGSFNKGQVKIMVKIQVVGPGCPKCKQLAANAQAAADSLGIAYEFEKVTGMAEMMALGVMMTPALIINGETKSVGKLLKENEIAALLS
jgi:small redox-active disulfide protein 2